ncbi:MAG: hypothetical protein DMF75_05755 [Acidobacteria bacterium]|nr:MAG: hypothetical protein DMF75_05755 [Acidobacteriota bacterium]
MPRLTNPRNLWLAMISGSAILRILGAFFLPNAFGDAYVYIRDIGAMSTKLSTHTFALTDLFGFWLPLYQLICAIMNVFVGNGFYVGKVVSAIFGVGVCLLVYSITLQLTANRTAALLAFVLIALNPLHILISASAMTDVPHAFFVSASLYFILRRGWVAAAIFAALAGLTRVESWMLIALIPAIQFLTERRISVVAVLILLSPPVFWFYISWKATGNWLACFQARQQYHDWLLAMNPRLGRFALRQALRDGASLLVSTDIAVFLAAFWAGWKVFKRLLIGDKISNEMLPALPSLIFLFAFLGLLIFAYLTHQQPIIFPRYGLILFSLGIPVLAWIFLTLRKEKPHLARRLLISVIAICAFDAGVQLVGSVGLLNQYSAQRAVADYLRDHFPHDGNRRIFCDEGTVRALSGIPPEKFLSSADAPHERYEFLAFLNERNVEYLVIVKKEDSIPSKLFPWSEYGEQIGPFESLMNAHSEFLPMKIWLYRANQQ